MSRITKSAVIRHVMPKLASIADHVLLFVPQGHAETIECPVTAMLPLHPLTARRSFLRTDPTGVNCLPIKHQGGVHQDRVNTVPFSDSPTVKAIAVLDGNYVALGDGRGQNGRDLGRGNDRLGGRRMGQRRGAGASCPQLVAAGSNPQRRPIGPQKLIQLRKDIEQDALARRLLKGANNQRRRATRRKPPSSRHGVLRHYQTAAIVLQERQRPRDPSPLPSPQ
jgi:hypothetical protein